MLNYYSILQINPSASEEEIKRAYHRMAKLYHPDNFKGSLEDSRLQMTLINEAYTVLSDKEKRREYDASLSKSTKYSQQTDDMASSSGKETRNRTNSADNVSYDEQFQQTGKANAAKKHASHKNGTKRILSLVISKAIEWIFTIAIICLVANHFGWIDKVKEIIHDINIEESVSDDEIEPEEIVKTYFEEIRNGNCENATRLFSNKDEERFSPVTIEEYNRTITQLYYEIDSSYSLYPLFEQVRNFEYEIQEVNYDRKKNQVKVKVYINNFDAYLMEKELIDSDTLDYIQSKNDKELQQIVKSEIKRYGDSCMVDTYATFVLEKVEDVWKINYITPLRDFSRVLVGDSDTLFLELNGENLDGQEDSESIENYFESTEYDDSVLW